MYVCPYIKKKKEIMFITHLVICAILLLALTSLCCKQSSYPTVQLLLLCSIFSLGHICSSNLY